MMVPRRNYFVPHLAGACDRPDESIFRRGFAQNEEIFSPDTLHVITLIDREVLKILVPVIKPGGFRPQLPR